MRRPPGGSRTVQFDARTRLRPEWRDAPSDRGETAMAWRIEGTYFETCSCEVSCPCTTSLTLGADYDRCNATLVFHIKSGEIEGTDVSGLTVAAIADTPK